MTLIEARATLCDLLIGRRIRLIAAQFLDSALYLEGLGIPEHVIDTLLDEAAHSEWLAARAERGQLWFLAPPPPK